MNPATIGAVCTGVAGIIGAVTALVTALKAHQRINTMQGQSPAAAPPSSPQQPR